MPKRTFKHEISVTFSTEIWRYAPNGVDPAAVYAEWVRTVEKLLPDTVYVLIDKDRRGSESYSSVDVTYGNESPTNQSQ